jgi:hypothetical protein
MELSRPDTEAPPPQDPFLRNLLRWCAGVGAMLTVPGIVGIVVLLVNLRDSNREIKIQLSYLIAIDKKQDDNHEILSRAVDDLGNRLNKVEIMQKATNMLSRLGSRP